ncbi:hypothetical protein EW145_g2209 [Phellinidium pouzarii]|uniref:Uncharacterized protein n=1 Tax=Phellinidium pouzarii TaxID=167371 RepID=A0A4S4LC73_9AGAM|nr:hypothetical protein EW145_g2209 [Phellinidium pouzarii]
MFSKTILVSVAAVAFATSGAIAKPISSEMARRTGSVQSSSAPSFNNYMGISSMSNFDNFYGQNNFDGSQNEQTIIVQQQEVVCHTEEIEIVQQKLVVLMEVAKKIILEQVCQVEVQTVVIEQFNSQMSSFSNDIGHQSSKSASYDQNISGMLGQVMNSTGSLSNSNLGFNGTSVGNNSVVVSGNNWNDTTSPASVQMAKSLAKQAANSTSNSSSS